MIRYVLLLSCLLSVQLLPAQITVNSTTSSAGEIQEETGIPDDELAVKLDKDNRIINDRFAIALQIGTDLGGAIPFPLRYLPTRFQPYPRLSPSIGGKVIFPIYKEWSLGVEATYKKIMMDADARVQDQRFKQYAEKPEDIDIIAAFTGTAEMKMDFTALELPIYATYTFRNFKDRILFGPYFAWMIDNKFKIVAQKGYLTDADGVYTDEIKAENPLDIDFSRSLSGFDIGLLVGYERAISERIDLGVRMMVGLKDIFKSDEKYLDYSMSHMRASIVLSYALVNIRSKKNILGYELKELNRRER